MPSIPQELSRLLTETAASLFPETTGREVAVKRTEAGRFGDYQTEFAMANARLLKKPPLEIAETLSAALPESPLIEKTEIAKPGFINFTLSAPYLGEQAARLLTDALAASRDLLKGQSIVIDYSSPNVAKTMHIGHFRATITGDAICRMLRFAGAQVISDNHIGDWGTQFGKLIVAFRLWADRAAYGSNPVPELERLYQKFEKEKDPALEEKARQELVRLQQGAPENLALWKDFTDHSLRDFQSIYDRLGIHFDHTLGESHYQPMLAEVAAELEEKGIAHPDQGALIVDTDGRYKIHGPVIIRKKDGGFGYAATDLATLRYRMENWRPQKIIYVTDSRQQDHFRSIFAISGEWLVEGQPDKIHVHFGSVKAPDGRSFSSREGNVVLFRELLDEAVERARRVVEEKNPSLPDGEKRHIADIVGVSALKYAELNHDLKSDTVFDWNRMLALEGNTAPYLLYTHARARSVLRKYAEAYGGLPEAPEVRVTNANERSLLILADYFPVKLRQAIQDLKPNHITEYAYQVAGEFNTYYNRPECPVLKEPDRILRESRVFFYGLVCDLLRNALSLLGIEALEKM